MTAIGPYVVVFWTLSRLVLVRKGCNAAFLLYSQSNMVEQAVTCFCVHQSAGHRACRVQLTVKAEIFGGVLFSVTSVPKFLPKIKRTENVGIVLVHLPGTRVYRKFPSAEPPILENTEDITPPKISAFTVLACLTFFGCSPVTRVELELNLGVKVLARWRGDQVIWAPRST